MNISIASQIISEITLATNMAGFVDRTKKQVSSLYSDPTKWGVVKSVGLFLFGIYLARDLKGISLDSAAPSA